MKNKIRILFTTLSLSTCAIAQANENKVAIPKQLFNRQLHDMLPADIKQSGTMISVANGSFPPYIIIKDDQTVEGAAIDIDHAISQILGINIEHKNVSGLSSILMGIKAGRYQYDDGPVGDFAKREKSVDFVDYVQEFVVFAVQKGNPKQINGLETTCGKHIAVMGGGSAERVIKVQSKKCVAAGRKAVTVLSYTDQPTSILAVRSNRADAFFSSQAPLSYFVTISHGALELAGTGKANGFQKLYQGAVVPKGSSLGKVLKAAYEELHQNGTYDAILDKWSLTGNRLAQPGINLSTAQK